MMITYLERSFALATPQSSVTLAPTGPLPSLCALLLHLHLLLLQNAGLTLTKEIVLFMQQTLALLGHHPTAVRTWGKDANVW